MFQVNDDLSIYVTRGDMVFLRVTAQRNGSDYTFEAGEVLRIKVFGKKDAETVVLQKDFPVTATAQAVDIILTEEDTKIGDVISKPKDYWYEVELNPYDDPMTIIGYDEDGPKVFRLFPEGADIPEYVPDPEVIKVIDTELDMTSERPVQNQVIARAFANLRAGYQAIYDSVSKLNANFGSASEQSFSSGSDFSVSIPIPDNTVKNYLVTVNSNGELATVRTAIIAVINGSAYTGVYEMASYGDLPVTYELSGGLLKITPSDNYGGIIVVRQL